MDTLIAGVRKKICSLFIVPFIILTFGNSWTLDRSSYREKARLYSMRKLENTSVQRVQDVRLWFYPDGSDWSRGVPLTFQSCLEIDLSRPVSQFSLTVQADANDKYLVMASAKGTSYHELWLVPEARGVGLQTRQSQRFRLDKPVRFVRIKPASGDGVFSVAGLKIEQPPFAIPHWLVIIFLWTLFMIGYGARKKGLFLGKGAAFDAIWNRGDAWFSAAIVFTIFFRVTGHILVFGVVVCFLLLLFRVVSVISVRWPLVTVSAFVISVVLLSFVLPGLVTDAVMTRIAMTYNIDVDHRLRPDGKEINTDGARFKQEASTLTDDDFVVLFLGDSYTYGVLLAYDETYPYQFEAIARARGCSEAIRVVNFGWPSCSPLLAYRLLVEKGLNYKPDLVVYNLDMTDFYDDLRYEWLLRQGGRFKPNPADLLNDILRRKLPRLYTFFNGDESIQSLLRPYYLERPHYIQEAIPVPGEGYFVMREPLENTRPLIEAGVMKNLDRLASFTEKTLQCPFCLVLVPRSAHYSLRESPKNWEAHMYQAMGPYVLEVFRYFEEINHRLTFPVLDLLPAFRDTDEFPLYFERDPHWNAAGCRFAATHVCTMLADTGLLPCPTQE